MLNISDSSSCDENGKSYYINREILLEIIPILEKFNVALKVTQSDLEPTFHEVPLWVAVYFSNLFKQTEHDSTQIKSLKTIFEKLFKEKVTLFKENKFASVLHPEFRTLKFYGENERIGVYSHLKDEMRKIENNLCITPNEATTTHSNAYKSENSVMDVDAEMEMYLKCAQLKNNSLFSWWKKMKKYIQDYPFWPESTCASRAPIVQASEFSRVLVSYSTSVELI